MITKARTKKAIPAMIPVKKWLSLNEAAAYLDMSTDHFNDLSIIKGLTISAVGRKKYYKVSELEKMIEESVIIKQTA